VCTQYYQGGQGGSIAKSIFYFIETDIPQVAATHRVINLNYSIHGVLKQINAI
jgi:hypothetical protein